MDALRCATSGTMTFTVDASTGAVAAAVSLTDDPTVGSGIVGAGDEIPARGRRT